MTAKSSGLPLRCPCCKYKTLSARGQDEICPVCFWHDDGQDDEDADSVMGGPNKDLSLTKGRKNFERLGAYNAKYIEHVRPPTPAEL